MQNSPLALLGLVLGIVLLTVVSFASGWMVGRTTATDVSNAERLARLEQRIESERTAPAPAPAAARAAAQPERAAPAAEAVQQVDVAGSPSMGPDDAKVTIVEFSDFECPFCARVTPTLDQLRENYPDAVRVVFKHFPLAIHPNAMNAHKASQAAGDQGKFWEMHDWIFENRDKLSPEQLRAQAEALGLDMAKYDATFASAELEQRIRADQAQGERLGVRGTPTFFINGRLISGAQPYSAFEERVKAELGEG